MRVFTPQGEVLFPLQRTDATVHRLLRDGEPYLLHGHAEALFDQYLRQGHIKGTMEAVEPRKITPDSRRVLTFWTGEMGDAVCHDLAAFRWGEVHDFDTEFGFVTVGGEQPLFEYRTTFEYPIPLRLACGYDAWVEFNAREHLHVEIIDAYATALGLDADCPGTLDALTEDEALARALLPIIANPDRPKVAVRLYCDSHYRSWVLTTAYAVMRGLAADGIDCYIIDSAQRRPVFNDAEGNEQRLFGDGIYDLCGLLQTCEEQASFLSHMDAVVCPDGGLMQLALALEKPTLCLFGPTRGEARCKYAPTLRWINGDHQRGCAPCWTNNDHPPCEGRFCGAICNITPEQVIEEVKDMLGRG